MVRGDEVESFFAGREDGAGIGAPEGGDVALHFSDGGLVDLNERDVIAANSQSDCADASVEVNHRRIFSVGVTVGGRCTLWTRSPFSHIAQGLLVHGYIHLKESFAGVAEWRTKNRIGECSVAKFCEARGDAASWAARVRIDDLPALRG